MEFHLVTFLAVCQEMNFTRAAETLHITQPAVSHHIHWLEQEYGAPLLVFEGKRMYLTPAGELLRDAATAMKNDEDVLRRRIRTERAGAALLRLGATRTIGELGIAGTLAEYLRRRPETELQLEVDNTDHLLTALQEGRLQCALIEGYFDPHRFDSVRYGREEYVAVCAAGHAFSQPPRVLRDLLGERLLVREPGSGTREILENLLRREDLRCSDFARVTQIGAMQVILELLAQDVGIGFLYRMAAQDLLAEGRLRELPLEGLPVQHDFSLVWERGSRYAPEYQALCRELQAAAEAAEVRHCSHSVYVQNSSDCL
jgi:DNA-binding transcriptional LysR family regulator